LTKLGKMVELSKRGEPTASCLHIASGTFVAALSPPPIDDGDIAATASIIFGGYR
jgi:hypothetical protein